MVIKALLDGSITGVGKYHRTSIFPCGIFQCAEGINRKEGDPNYDLFKLALKSTAMRLYPNYANVDWSVVAGYDKDDPRTYFSTMGCHKRDTMIWMADNSRKAVQDIVVGDKVQGPDSTPRTVIDLIRGRGEMFKVSYNGEKWNPPRMGLDTYPGLGSIVVNKGHILSLVYVGDKDCEVPIPTNVSMSEDDGKILHFDNLRLTKGTIYNLRVFELLEHPILLKLLKGYDVLGGKHEISIEQVEDDEYFGFDIDGDRLYVVDGGIVTHNCRTVNGADINADPGVNPQMRDGRGNISPVTIIMPTLAMEAKESVSNEREKDLEKGLGWSEDGFESVCVEKFMKLLDKKIFEARDMLLERFDWQCSQPENSATFMYENGTMLGDISKEGIRGALKHGTLVIGQLGLAEALQLLIGKDHTTEEGMKLAKRIEQLFKDRCAEFKKQLKLNFGVYYTPAESLCHTALKKFRDKYGVIENVSDKEFFTNSMHVPVWKKINPFEKIDIEAQLTGYSNAGCITYVEIPGEAIRNIDALEKLVNYAMDRDIPYFAINVPSDFCCKCGYQGDIPGACPQCGNEEIDRLRRVTGYLSTTVKHFNKGKQDEVAYRVKHTSVCIDK